MADLLIASEFWLSLASCNLEVARGDDGRTAHVMKPIAIEGAGVMVFDDKLEPLGVDDHKDVTGMISGFRPTG